MSLPPSVALNVSHSCVEGQHASPGKQRHDKPVEAEAMGSKETRAQDSFPAIPEEAQNLDDGQRSDHWLALELASDATIYLTMAVLSVACSPRSFILYTLHS